ncbi:MAG: helix-turn-helix domain-containing protein [Sandarakinorhabdus sp.]
MREYLLEGNRVSLLEAMLLFGVQNPNAEFTRLKKDGFVVKSGRVSMAKIIRRLNEVAVCQPPPALPYKEIFMTEYWIGR